MSHPDIRHSENPVDATIAQVNTERGFAHDRGDQGRLLASALSWNMLFSAASGIVLLAGNPVLNRWLGVSAWLLGATGVGLLLFAGSLLWLLSGTRHLQWGARAVIAADLGWVAAASVVLLAFPDVLSPAGQLVLVALTAVVVVVAAGQLVGLRRAGRGPVTGVAPLMLTVERILAAHPERVWAAVANAGDYARFAPGIASTEIVSGDGSGMVRVCTDEHGGQWSETCTLWEEGVRYRMTVDVDSYPAYYRMLLHRLEQTWSVGPVAEGTRLALRFDGAVKLGIVGRVAAGLLGNRRRLEAILDAYGRELGSSVQLEARADH